MFPCVFFSPYLVATAAAAGAGSMALEGAAHAACVAESGSKAAAWATAATEHPAAAAGMEGMGGMEGVGAAAPAG